eukprot:CAMPEP_0197310202 /NCGR_PEP_ID=MMETSP0891-20130614/8820_1 /TAXON_ID=44058 ORGANISM="Aureoumbra lagunensis, Strain CCMP1510" /NCGR_SAMPLE_ID=MMETSP0891 /ASSEMBLY_ACC=CAM_ASM_000534 /LENGTH=233 /DNA_ID=CAMNT_0042795733 /DNA_START=38 /DNA_END=735 /DNA_ORIENTATION=-
MPPPNLRLVYLDQRMLAEPIRLTLFLGKIEFEDIRVSYDQVKSMRAAGTLPHGQVPIMEIDGTTYSQTAAILRYVGRQTGLYTENNALLCDSIEAALADIRICMRPLWYDSVLGRHPVTGDPTVLLTEDQKTQIQILLNNEILPARFSKLEHALSQSGGPYFCGSSISICDLSWYNMCIGILEGFYCGPRLKPTVLQGNPRLLKLAALVHNHPRIHLWNQQHNYSTPPELLRA